MFGKSIKNEQTSFYIISHDFYHVKSFSHENLEKIGRRHPCIKRGVFSEGTSYTLKTSTANDVY